MGISGDFSRLREWGQRMARIPGGLERAAAEVAPKLKNLVEQGFVTKTDPYGGSWKPIKPATYARGTESPLFRTGRMVNEIDYLPLGKRIKIALGVFYARFHISTGRRTLPKPGDLPTKWSTFIKAEVDKVLTSIAGGS